MERIWSDDDVEPRSWFELGALKSLKTCCVLYILAAEAGILGYKAVSIYQQPSASHRQRLWPAVRFFLLVTAFALAAEVTDYAGDLALAETSFMDDFKRALEQQQQQGSSSPLDLESLIKVNITRYLRKQIPQGTRLVFEADGYWYWTLKKDSPSASATQTTRDKSKGYTFDQHLPKTIGTDFLPPSLRPRSVKSLVVFDPKFVPKSDDAVVAKDSLFVFGKVGLYFLIPLGAAGHTVYPLPLFGPGLTSITGIGGMGSGAKGGEQQGTKKARPVQIEVDMIVDDVAEGLAFLIVHYKTVLIMATGTLAWMIAKECSRVLVVLFPSALAFWGACRMSGRRLSVREAMVATLYVSCYADGCPALLVSAGVPCPSPPFWILARLMLFWMILDRG